MIAHNPADQEGRRSMSVRPVTGDPRHPALVERATERRGSLQYRMTGRITQFAGSMAFVYLHVLWFFLWITLTGGTTPAGRSSPQIEPEVSNWPMY